MSVKKFYRNVNIFIENIQKFRNIDRNSESVVQNKFLGKKSINPKEMLKCQKQYKLNIKN